MRVNKKVFWTIYTIWISIMFYMAYLIAPPTF